MNLSEAVNAYVSERRRSQTLAPNSVAQVRQILWRFASYFGEDRDPATITLAEVSEWRAQLDVGPRTLRCYTSQTRGLFTWLLLRDEILRDPFQGIKPPRQPDSEPRAFERETVGIILDACADARERLIVSLKAQEGLRAGEVAHLEVAHVSISRGAVMVRGGKGNKDRTVPLTDETRRALTDYLAEYPARGAGPLIRSYQRPSSGISPGRVSRMLVDLMYRAGVKERPRDGVSGHALRHTAGADVLAAAEGDLLVVKEFLGHASIATTQIYTRTTTAERLRAVVNGRTYRNAS